MSKRKKIAVLDGTFPLLSFYKQAHSLGYEIHSFDWSPEAPCRKYADFFYPISYRDIEKVVKICMENDVKGVISFSAETALSAVNEIARRLNSPGNPIECEKLMENKYAMRERLKECGISIPKYHIIESINQEIDVKYPVIVKPTDNGGSRGVTKVAKKEELKPAIKRAMEFARNKKVLVEDFIDGREFSVEYISHEGRHYFLTITDKVTTGSPYFVELEHHQPALISDTIVEKIKRMTVDTLNALKVYSSASHTEIKMNRNGDLFIIETGARMGGDFIASDLVYLSTGYDFVKGAMDLAIGEFKKPVIKDHLYSGVYFLTKEREYIKKHIENCNNLNYVVDAAIYGKPIINVKESNDRAGHLIYKQNNEKLLLAFDEEN